MGQNIDRRLNSIRFATSTVALILYAAGGASAANEVGKSLAERARQSQSITAPVDEERIDKAKKRLVEETGRLNGYLNRQSKRGLAWKRYLKLDELRTALADDEPADEPLLISLQRFRSNYAGLERSVFLNVASVLDQYLRVGGEAARATAAADVNRKLTELATALETLDVPPTREQQSAVGKLLAWFSDRDQQAELVDAIRERLGQANLHARVSQDLIGSGSVRKIDEAGRPVRDVILGTRLYGVRRTNGFARTRLVPDARRASFETMITATNQAQTMGYNRSARIASTSVTSLWGVKRYYLDETGFHYWQATSHARSRTRIVGVGSSRRGLRGHIVRRAAGRRASRRKATAEQIGSRHVERQLNARLDAEAKRRLNRAQADYLANIRYPLLRMGQWPRWLRLASTAEQLSIDARHESNSRLAATSASPGLPDNAALAVELHESLANSFGEGLLAGRTVGQADLDKLSLELFRRRPQQLELDETKGAWSMTFADQDPIDVRIDDGQVWLTLRGHRFRSQQKVVDRELEITVHYFLENDNGVLKARRDNDVIVRSPSGSGTLDIAGASLVRRRLRDFFTEEITSRGLVLPGQFAKVGRLTLTHLLADGGWLSLAWNREKDK